jgi:hypothetical protein
MDDFPHSKTAVTILERFTTDYHFNIDFTFFILPFQPKPARYYFYFRKRPESVRAGRASLRDQYLVLMGIKMPVMNDFDAERLVRQNVRYCPELSCQHLPQKKI